MTHPKRAALTVGLVILAASAGETACGRNVPHVGPPPQPTQSSPAREDVSGGWRRHQLEGGGGDHISALLPQKPEDFGVANMRRPAGEPLPARVHMLSADAKVYFAIFVDLPRPAAEMSSAERADVFHGSWMGLARRTGEALEEKFGAPFPVTESAGRVGEAPGGERHMQDFRVGTQQGRAQAMFVGRRAYLVAAVWDGRPGSEQDAMRFLNSFQVKTGRPRAGVE